MSKENSISIVIPDDVLKKVRENLNLVAKELEPYVLALTPSQRKTIPKMADRSEPFVSKVLEYVQTNPEFCPPFMETGELKKDFDVVVSLMPILRSIEQINDNVNDTTMLAGSECYVLALSYYNSVKLAAKMNIPNAKAIHDDLKKRFESHGKRKPA